MRQGRSSLTISRLPSATALQAQLGYLHYVLHVIDVDGIEATISLDRGEDPFRHFLLALIVPLGVADVDEVRVAGSQRDRGAVGCVDVAVVEVRRDIVGLAFNRMRSPRRAAAS